MNTLALAPEFETSGDVSGGWVHAFGAYYPRRNAAEHRNSPWSQAVILAKRRHERIIERFGKLIAAHLATQLRDGCDYIVTPVPTGPQAGHRLFRDGERGVTELLADRIQSVLSGRLRIRTEDLLVQVRSKPMRQHDCASLAGRAANVQGVYSLRGGITFTGRSIILVDDVITSGATMNECARVLRAGGAQEVMGVALARTVRL
jgi:predicted amidophosphoribosyltransferase